MVVQGAAAAGAGGGDAVAPHPSGEILKALRSPSWAAGGEPRKMVQMTQGYCRSESSLNTLVGCPR